MQALENRNALLELLAQGATVLTPNNRLSAALLDQFFKATEAQTVTKPTCLPYSTAVTKAYQQLLFAQPNTAHPLLFNQAQCQHVWRQIIQSEPTLTYSEGLLGAVMQAFEHAQQWNINPAHSSFDHTPQTQQFQRWWQDFNQQLTQKNALSEHQLIPYLIQKNTRLFSKPVVWICFDDFTPQQLSLQQHLTDCGLTQYAYDLKDKGCMPLRLAAKDGMEEYDQLIAWLHVKLQQGDQRIGVVIPQLAQESRAFHRMLLKHFDSDLFNISLGQPLSHFPLIAHALNWLELDKQHLNPHKIALLLQSPYLACAKEEFGARTTHWQDSQLNQDQSVPFTAFIQDLKAKAPQLTACLNKIKPYPKKASPQEWVKQFQERLNGLGFPGDYGLNSENYQCLNRFSALFDELRQLALVSPQFTAAQALSALKLLAENTIFQAQKTTAVIQVSGLLEASGCEFDSLWVMGLTDQCLPQKARLSAFISPQLQRELLMPHSLPERELLFAQQTLDRLRKGSTSTVFSYSRLQGDSPNLPCALITEFPPFQALTLNAKPEQLCALISLEEMYQLPLTSEERASGGTALLANQAKCPFKAFAEHRLQAKPSPTGSDGLNNRERGQVIHRVMELLWRPLSSQHNLLQLSPSALNQAIDKAIQTTLDPLKLSHPDGFPALIQEIESLRLKRLVLSCLEWEKQRPPFEIEALEQSYSIALAGIEFKVRVDRLDRVGEKKWVIDYKSSLPASKPWYEDRPKEPQLLLYALLDESINALLLLQLKTGQLTCSGLSEEKQTITGITALKKEMNWTDCTDEWRHQLTLLAEEFKQGHCPPTPISPAICQQCDFQNLCRFQAGE